MRHAARVDASQTAIVSALEAAGASVWIIGRPVDAIVGLASKTLLMEFKTAGTYYGRKLNKNQQKFMDGWKGGPVCLVDSPEAALRALGVLK